MKNSKIKMLCEAAMLLALAQILSYIKFFEFPNGGSIDCAMIPIILFAVRYGWGWGSGVGLIYGVLQYYAANGISISWVTLIADYFIAYVLLGFGAGLFRGRKYGVYLGTAVGGTLRFLAHLVVGAIVWGQYMPPSFFGLTMTNEWFYSFLYNISYMLPDICICMLLFALLYRPLKKFFTCADLRTA
ncbi:MAG: energy-coupled thiamine transporter ThiT [Oscillibacter sp.]|jgi:thiamine transporter|nr:energy-coupled thiamine transporter ThiT [Oscillibacter sp.]